MDRISQLPECIIHRILSSFDTSRSPPVEHVRMRVLSKNWFDLTSSFPILDFNIFTFNKIGRRSFYKYAEYTTSRFCLQNVSANTLKLVTTIDEPAELDIVNRCVELLLNKGVQLLVFDIYNGSNLQKYRLPNILLSVSVLKSLTISGCELPSSLMVDDVKFKSLIMLKLVSVNFDDETIKYLITSCPLLQEFDIINCHGFKRFCVYGHQNLEAVKIYYSTRFERIDIEAPNLSDLTVIDLYESGPPRMNLGSCKKLTSVFYDGYLLQNSNGFTDLLSNFPFIQNLCLVTKNKCHNLKLSSHSLRTLLLNSIPDSDNIEFKTPNLDLFIYCYYYQSLHSLSMMERWPLVCHLPYLKKSMQCYLDGCIDAHWFQKLRLFLFNKIGFKVLNLYIDTMYSGKIRELENLKAIELPPYELDHVEIVLDTRKKSSNHHVAFVDVVLRCCCPRSLTLKSYFPLNDFEDVVKFTYKKLLEQEDENHTNIQIMLPHEEKSVTFIKEEVTYSQRS